MRKKNLFVKKKTNKTKIYMEATVRNYYYEIKEKSNLINRKTFEEREK